MKRLLLIFTILLFSVSVFAQKPYTINNKTIYCVWRGDTTTFITMPTYSIFDGTGWLFIRYDSVVIDSSWRTHDDGQINGKTIGRGKGNSYLNTVFGDSCLNRNTIGGNNSAFGYFSLKNNTTGDDNCAFGMESLESNISGTYNSAFGKGALWQNTTGGENTAMGEFGLGTNTTGYGNISLGFSAGAYTDLSYRLYINGIDRASVKRDTTRSIIYGYMNADSALQRLWINAYLYTPLDAYIHYKTLGRGSGNIQTNTVYGDSCLNRNVTGYDNTALGYHALKDNTDHDNTAVGWSALEVNTSGSSNSAFGAAALLFNISGICNTAIGTEAIQSNTSGDKNTVIGFHALSSSLDGDDNTVIGDNAMMNVTHGSNNVAVGRYSLVYCNGSESGNIALGYYSGERSYGMNNRLYINNHDQGTRKKDTTRSIIYGVMDADSSLQHLWFNSNVNATGFFINDFGTRHLINDTIPALNLPFTGAFKTDGVGYLISGILPYPTITHVVQGYYKSSGDQQLFYADSTRLNIYSMSPLRKDTAFSGIHSMRGKKNILSNQAYETDLHLNTCYGLELAYRTFVGTMKSMRAFDIDSVGYHFNIMNVGGATSSALDIDSNKNITFNSQYTFPLTDGATGDVLTTDGGGTVTWSAGGTVADSVPFRQVGNSIFNKVSGSFMINGVTGATPISGAGTRMMWIPAKGAFRAGVVDATQWDNANIGDHSVSMGESCASTGTWSFTHGRACTGTNDYSVGIGNAALSTGYCSFSLGNSTEASGARSLATNYVTTATGSDATAMGTYTTAQAYSSFVCGQYNEVSGTIGSWVSTDPLFVVGNGSGTGVNSHNAFAILKDGTKITDTLRTGEHSRTAPDGVVFAAPTGIVGRGWVSLCSATTVIEWADFYFNSDGTVVLIQNSANVVNTDTGGKFCIYDAGSGFAFKNRTGTPYTLKYRIEY